MSDQTTHHHNHHQTEHKGLDHSSESRILDKINEQIPEIKVPFPPTITPEELVKLSKDGTLPLKLPNSFFIYRRAFQTELTRQGIRKPLHVISKMVSESWKKEPTGVKREYKELARRANRYLAELRLSNRHFGVNNMVLTSANSGQYADMRKQPVEWAQAYENHVLEITDLRPQMKESYAKAEPLVSDSTKWKAYRLNSFPQAPTDPKYFNPIIIHPPVKQDPMASPNNPEFFGKNQGVTAPFTNLGVDGKIEHKQQQNKNESLSRHGMNHNRHIEETRSAAINAICNPDEEFKAPNTTNVDTTVGIMHERNSNSGKASQADSPNVVPMDEDTNEAINGYEKNERIAQNVSDRSIPQNSAKTGTSPQTKKEKPKETDPRKKAGIDALIQKESEISGVPERELFTFAGEDADDSFKGSSPLQPAPEDESSAMAPMDEDSGDSSATPVSDSTEE